MFQGTRFRALLARSDLFLNMEFSVAGEKRGSAHGGAIGLQMGRRGPVVPSLDRIRSPHRRSTACNLSNRKAVT